MSYLSDYSRNLMEKIVSKRPADRTKWQEGSAFDRIKYHYLGKLRKEKLTAKELQLMDRWEQVWTLYKRHLKSSLAVKYHREICQRQGYGISSATAYRDLQQATKIWGQLTRLDRQAKLVLLDEMATDTFLAARDQDELGEMNRAIANLLKINEQVDEHLEDYREPHKYELHLHLNGELRTLDLNKLPTKHPDYQQVLDEVEDQELTEAELLDD